jgi:excinuclease ABC subunit B
MYADKMTPSMAEAIDETNRRREKQVGYNLANGVDPQPLRKKIHDILDDIYREAEDAPGALVGHGAGGAIIGGSGRQMSRGKAPTPGTRSRDRGRIEANSEGMAKKELTELINELTEQMLGAAAELQFELAARIRDEIKELKRELRQMNEAA